MGRADPACSGLCVAGIRDRYSMQYILIGLQKGSEVLGYEAEALAIYDLMRFVKPPISTLCVGNAFGEAAMLLAAGQKVCRPRMLFAWTLMFSSKMRRTSENA